MSIFSGAMVYVLIWWMTMFCLLPFKIGSSVNTSDGSMPGAPINPGVKWKAMLATGIAAAVWLIINWIINANLISFHDIAQKMSV